MNRTPNKRIFTTLGDGRWFDADPHRLQQQVDAFINAAEGVTVTGRIVSAIAPHAGYIYSGAVAGYTYRALRDAARSGFAPDLVVVLGLAHRRALSGVALLDADAIRSPLGETTLDVPAATMMAKHRSRIRLDSDPHYGEHSAENQVPFIQTALPDTPLVIGIMGDHDAETLKELGDALEALAHTRRVLVIASTDLLHDADYEKVSTTDKQTLAQVVKLDDKAITKSWRYDHQVCCGIGPVLTAMRYARRQGCREGTLLHYRNSGDDHPESRGNWVVGYGAVIFTL